MADDLCLDGSVPRSLINEATVNISDKIQCVNEKISVNKLDCISDKKLCVETQKNVKCGNSVTGIKKIATILPTINLNKKLIDNNRINRKEDINFKKVPEFINLSSGTEKEDRKKRCSDRYDSSESSDSGVATLSCTDSSTTSSDSSDPGSPYSPASVCEENLINKIKMPPQSHLISKAQWPWHQTLNGNNQDNKLKRLTTEDQTTVTITKRIRKNVEKLPNLINNKKAAIVLPKPKAIPTIEDEQQPQTKITGYFKSQVKKNKVLPNNFPLRTDFELRTLTTMTPSLKKIERKTPKVSPVVLLNSRNQKLAPKKPVSIAPRTSKPKPLMNVVKPQDDKSSIVQQPTVLLTAIRIPQQQQQSTLPTTTKQIPTNKVGPVYQFQPVMPNLVQIPNLLNKNSSNLILPHTTQYFMNNGTVIKLTQTNGTSGTTTSVVTVDSGINNYLNGGKQPTVPFTTTNHQQSQQQQKLNGSTATATHIAQMYMTTSSGILLNTALPSVMTSQQFNGIHQTINNQQAQLPALHPIQQHTANILPSISTMLPNNHHHHQLNSYQQHQQSYLTSHSSSFINSTNFVVPQPQLNTGLVTTYSTIKNPTPAPQIVLTEPPKLVPCQAALKIETAFPTIPVLPQQQQQQNLLDLCSPTIPLLSPKEQQQNCLASPKSLVLEKIRQKTFFKLTTTDLLTEESPPKIDTEFQTASLPECAKSPILSQPKTIRFPAEYNDVIRLPGSRIVRKSDGSIVGMCYWDKCNANYDTCSKLLDHLQQQHVNLQTGPFSCLWSGCKVHGRESCSRQWLERHVLSHGGTKPFKCIVDGCGLRFGSQLAVQKHVNQHFTSTDNSTKSSNRNSDPPMPKNIRKNGKKLRYRRQPWSARMFDYFDGGIMEGLQHRLLITNQIASSQKGAIHFVGCQQARRTTLAGVVEILVKWNPSDIIEDEWIPESKTKSYTKDVLVHQLKASEQIALENYFKFSFKETELSSSTSSSPQQQQQSPASPVKQHRKNQRKQQSKPS